MYHSAYFTPQNVYRTRSNKSAVKSFKYSVDDVWAAAVAAQRVNGAYLKEALYKTNEDGSSELVRKRNRDVIMDFLAVPGTITDEDREAGRECRKYLQNDLTFRALKGQLSAFDASVKHTVAVEDEFDSVQHRLELATVACLPQSHQRSLARANTDDQLRKCTTLESNVGDKVAINVEVVRSNYSQQYGIHWITATTQDERAVFFSCREGHNPGTHLTIKGTVKIHRDGKTQLTRVKVL